jgi:hypothetical protein
MESESGVVMALAGPVLFGLAALLRMSRDWRRYSVIRRNLHQAVIEMPNRPIDDQWHPAGSKESAIGTSASC